MTEPIIDHETDLLAGQFRAGLSSPEARSVMAQLKGLIEDAERRIAILAESLPNGGVGEADITLDGETVLIAAQNRVDGTTPFRMPAGQIDIIRPSGGFAYVTDAISSAFLPHYADSITLAYIDSTGSEVQLAEGVDFTYNPSTGEITLMTITDARLVARGASSGSWTMAVIYSRRSGFYGLPIASRDPDSRSLDDWGHVVEGWAIGFVLVDDVAPPGPPEVNALDVLSHHYRHVQAEASNEWTITHGLGRNPSVTVMIGGHEAITEVEWPDIQTVVVRTKSPQSGEAYLA